MNFTFSLYMYKDKIYTDRILPNTIWFIKSVTFCYPRVGDQTKRSNSKQIYKTGSRLKILKNI